MKEPNGGPRNRFIRVKFSSFNPALKCLESKQMNSERCGKRKSSITKKNSITMRESSNKNSKK
jgi:hypothetical protein